MFGQCGCLRNCSQYDAVIHFLDEDRSAVDEAKAFLISAGRLIRPFGVMLTVNIMKRVLFS